MKWNQMTLQEQVKCLWKKVCDIGKFIDNFNQDNFVRILEINGEDLSNVGTLKEQICEYILALPASQRTILETDSKWNVVIIGEIPEPKLSDNTFDGTFN